MDQPNGQPTEPTARAPDRLTRAPARCGACTLPVELRRARSSRWHSLTMLLIELTRARLSRLTQRTCDPRESAIFLFAQSFCYDIKHFATNVASHYGKANLVILLQLISFILLSHFVILSAIFTSLNPSTFSTLNSAIFRLV
jgi:hypothetical protein